MDEEPRVHALEAGSNGGPGSALDSLADEGVLGDKEAGGGGKSGTEVLQLLDGEALVADAGDEVAAFELLLHDLHCLFLLSAADGGADGSGGGGVSTAGPEGEEKGVGERFKGKGLCLSAKKRRRGGATERGLHGRQTWETSKEKAEGFPRRDGVALSSLAVGGGAR